MPGMSDIRFHIKSVKQTRQITNAMRLVSAARMRRALAGIQRNRAYFFRALDVITDIRAHTGETEHPYIHGREGRKAAYIVVAGERGLSGSYNRDAIALAERGMAGRQIARLFTVGAVATFHFQRAGFEPDARFERLAERPRLEEARRFAAILTDLYDGGEIDELHIVYTHFFSTVSHSPRDHRLLPIELGDFDFKRPGGVGVRPVETDILYDPSPRKVLDALIPQLIVGFLYGAMVHAYASENCTRMTAMENATRSADEMIEKLTLKYNSVRQLSITNELADIIGAANAANAAAAAEQAVKAEEYQA
ncbi:MAG: ATP synthase gamma chain, sodium ion specific [Firmicutes bacterium ADurb.Bin248]|nr:MAG: ATP synthase gamma chain, sodium ion specific [Firmicutes bacterium ADurb.Bin248]HOG01698.1 ATP synthase F1 subunit gamma [Clostridia bacterium]HPK15882.1 ATP synthase F1 subunit gamma [Clostridia bacterium]